MRISLCLNTPLVQSLLRYLNHTVSAFASLFPVTKEKICFVSSTKGMQRLVRDVGGDESQLESCCTGTKQTHLRPFDSKEYLLELPFDVAFDESISTTTTT